MTSKDYRKLEELLSNKDIYDFAQRLCENEKIDPIKDYPQTTESVVMQSAARRRLYVSNSAGLLRRAIFLGATKPEVLRMAIYLVVLMHSMDNSLDYSKCALDMNIKALEKKYDRNAYYSLDVPYEELASVIERDKNYYGVIIKNEDSTSEL